MTSMVRAGSATKLADPFCPGDLGSNVSFWSLVSRVSICYSGVEVIMPLRGCYSSGSDRQQRRGSAHLDSCSAGSRAFS